jgi:hypothetical protein
MLPQMSIHTIPNIRELSVEKDVRMPKQHDRIAVLMM